MGAAVMGAYGISVKGEWRDETQAEAVPSVADSKAPARQDDEVSVRQVPASLRTVRMKVTAYCLCEICCEKWAHLPERKTSIGDDAKLYDGVAADPKLLPYRTKLDIPGIGIKEVDDTGGGMRQSAKKGIYHIDVRMPSHSEARRFGVKYLEVKILK
jgi:3D (Asp-Asp-Asp) domain-containing protein